jgi:hypothetical protein
VKAPAPPCKTEKFLRWDGACCFEDVKALAAGVFLIRIAEIEKVLGDRQG